MAIKSASSVSKPPTSGQVVPGFKGAIGIRVKEQKYGPSSSGNPMITLKCEVVNPDKVKCDLDGGDYEIVGQELTYYIMLNEIDAKGKPSPNLWKFLNEFLPMCGLPSEFDDAAPLKSDANPNGINLVGTCFEAVVTARQRKEQRRNPDGSYSPLLDAQGKEIIKGWEWSSQTSDILRKIETVEGRTY